MKPFASIRVHSRLNLFWKRRRDLLLAGVVVVLVGLLTPWLNQRPIVTQAAWEVFEHYIKSLEVDSVKNRVAVVAVDDTAYSNFEIKEPMPRKYLAGLIATLCQNSHPQAIGIDVLLDALSPPGHEFEDDMLEEALQLAQARHVPVVLACNPEPSTHEPPIFPLPRFARWCDVGHALLKQDEHSASGEIRAVDWLKPFEKQRIPAFSALIAVRAQGLPASVTEDWIRKILRPRREFSSYIFFRPRVNIAEVPADEVVPENPAVAQSFEGKIVLIGATAKTRGDVLRTSLQMKDHPEGMPGVFGHAYAILTLIGPGLTVPPVWLESVLSMLLGGLFLGMLYRFGTARTFVWAALALCLLTAGTLLVCAFTGVLLNFAPSLGAIFLCGLAWWYWRKRYLNACYESFLTRPVVRGIGQVNNVEDFASTTAPGSILFCDLIGYSKACRELSPTEAIRLVNYYLSPVADIIQNYGGLLDKYLGDGCFAFFGVGTYGEKSLSEKTAALNAARAAWRIHQEMEKLRAEAEANNVPLLTLSMGIHTGPLTAGLVGPIGRKQFTVIGDSVNDACRVESIGHQTGVTPPFTTRIQVSEAAADLLAGVATLELKNYTPTEKYSAPIYELQNLVD